MGSGAGQWERVNKRESERPFCEAARGQYTFIIRRERAKERRRERESEGRYPNGPAGPERHYRPRTRFPGRNSAVEGGSTHWEL